MTGAGGLLSMQQAARSKPDGYTLVVGTASSTVVATAVRKAWPVDLVRDFTPVSLIANSTLLFVVAKDSPLKSMAEVAAFARPTP